LQNRGRGECEWTRTKIVKFYILAGICFESEVNQLPGISANASTSVPSTEPLITF
jgi:hypothetical protein